MRGSRTTRQVRHLFGIFSTLLFGSLLLARGATGVQEEPPASFTEQVSVDYVLVPVVVKGARGIIDDLPRESFQLLVDGEEVAIESFESGKDAPFTMFVLQDMSGSMELIGKLQTSKRILNWFLGRAQPGDRFALFTFAGREVSADVPLTSEIQRLRDAARQWHPYGITALHDAIGLVPQLVVESPTSQRAILLISDGLDNASEIEPKVARDRIRNAEIPVYVVGLDTGSPYELNSEGKKLYRYADVMNLLAHLTGGSYYSAVEETEVEAACEAILNELRSQYILGFSTGGSEEPAARSIEVRVKKRNLEVSHRGGYEGQPPLAPVP
jgi:Ca-activated chloride channel family protein